MTASVNRLRSSADRIDPFAWRVLRRNSVYLLVGLCLFLLTYRTIDHETASVIATFIVELPGMVFVYRCVMRWFRVAIDHDWHNLGSHLGRTAYEFMSTVAVYWLLGQLGPYYTSAPGARMPVTNPSNIHGAFSDALLIGLETSAVVLVVSFMWRMIRFQGPTAVPTRFTDLSRGDVFGFKNGDTLALYTKVDDTHFRYFDPSGEIEAEAGRIENRWAPIQLVDPALLRRLGVVFK